MALWGNNDNLLSPGTVSLDYSTGTVTASIGASFGFVGYGGTGNIIRFGVKGGEGGVSDFMGDAIIVGVTSFRQVTIGSTAGLNGVAIASTDYHVSELPVYTVGDSTFDEDRSDNASFKTHLSLPTTGFAAPNTKTVPVNTFHHEGHHGARRVPNDIKVGDAILDPDGSSISISGVNTTTVAATAANPTGINTTLIFATAPNGIRVGDQIVEVAPGSVDPTNLQPRLTITGLAATTISVASTTTRAIAAGTDIVFFSENVVSLSSTISATGIATGSFVDFQRMSGGYDRTVYGIGQTVGAGTSNFVGGVQYTTQGAGWVGVTTYIDNAGNLRVKSEILVAASGIHTGSNGLLYPTNVG